MINIWLILAIIMSILALQAKDLLNAVIFLAVLSLLSAVLYFYLHAPDVALTEAAVGAGISTFVFVWVIRHTRRTDDT